MARVAALIKVSGGEVGVVDEGIGPVVATPIMGWLRDVDGPVDEFNQTLVLQAPAGVSAADVETVLQAVLDRHATLRLQVEDDGDGDWSMAVPKVGSVDARGCIESVRVLSDAALVAARTRLNLAAGVLLRGLGRRHRPAGPDRPSLGRRWRVMANSVGRHQHRLGPAP